MSQISDNKNIIPSSLPSIQETDRSSFQELFKQLSDSSDDYYDPKEFIFEELRKHPGHKNYVFIFKKHLDDGFHVESYKTTDVEPYYIQHGISLVYSRGYLDEFEDVLPDFANWYSKPYFILAYDLHKDGVSVGPSYVMGYNQCMINGEYYNRTDYFRLLPELNINFREKYEYLDKFLDSRDDGVYVDKD